MGASGVLRNEEGKLSRILFVKKYKHDMIFFFFSTLYQLITLDSNENIDGFSPRDIMGKINKVFFFVIVEVHHNIEKFNVPYDEMIYHVKAKHNSKIFYFFIYCSYKTMQCTLILGHTIVLISTQCRYQVVTCNYTGKNIR